jgi:hypothetical protein
MTFKSPNAALLKGGMFLPLQRDGIRGSRTRNEKFHENYLRRICQERDKAIGISFGKFP